jgi:HlyD family secretion protein
VNRSPLYVLSAVGILAGISSAILYAQETPPLPPVFNPAANPYAKGIYANGIVESYQSQGENINIYPEISGPITKILVAEGDTVQKGAPLVTIDDSVQRATVEQDQSQADASLAMLKELKAEPRSETLAVSVAQVENAKATLKNAEDVLEKEEQSYKLDPQSVAKNDLDNARNAVRVAATNLEVVQKQYELTKAGAWVYDIENQEKQYSALTKAYAAGDALLSKYTIRAPIDGVVLSVLAAPGSYVSPQGAYDSYTQSDDPLVVMGTSQQYLEVRAYIDEILVSRLPPVDKIEARMFVQGTDNSVPLTYERTQPYVSPKIELSDQKQERVDVRVLPLIFRFDKPKDVNLYPGELVDVYIGSK